MKFYVNCFYPYLHFAVIGDIANNYCTMYSSGLTLLFIF